MFSDMTTKSPPDITVFDIADWFLVRAKSEDKPLKHMKLQKLVYFAYGWHFAFNDDLPLFKEDFYAWRRGIVVKDLFDTYQQFGSSPIIPEMGAVHEFDEDVTRLLRYVWELYGACSDSQLNQIVHRHDAPWNRSYRRDEWIPYAKIAPDVIRDYFMSLRIQYAEKH